MLPTSAFRALILISVFALLLKRCWSLILADIARLFRLLKSSSVSSLLPKYLQAFHELSPFRSIAYFSVLPWFTFKFLWCTLSAAWSSILSMMCLELDAHPISSAYCWSIVVYISLKVAYVWSSFWFSFLFLSLVVLHRNVIVLFHFYCVLALGTGIRWKVWRTCSHPGVLQCLLRNCLWFRFFTLTCSLTSFIMVAIMCSSPSSRISFRTSITIFLCTVSNASDMSNKSRCVW